MNCLVVDDDEFHRNIVKHFVSKTDGLVLVGETDNAADAFNLIKSKEIDIVFLDVEMPEMTGLDLMKVLDDAPQIILVTSRDNYAVEAFEYSVTDYLVKPINYSRFLKAVNKAESNLKAANVTVENQDEVFVKADNKIVKLRFSEIHFIEALSDYVIINTAQKKYIIHSTMKGLEKKLPESTFIRVHRSYIVNFNRIESIEDLNVVMPTKTIPIGASYKNKFMQKLNLL
ncbi:LytR/AlgR family response regulator transcription factor [Hugenholtzia roseola]|uniref:LytR/AlgR family response regulator transcription factor n=1 Tax=Hugenholtzia roseola TaxID=1002 RepID=UPI0004180C01|nr:LytTR family DNA-binding domain-containing protein [Hugenholtzia roseola]